MKVTRGMWTVWKGGNFILVFEAKKLRKARYLDRKSGCIAEIRLPPRPTLEDYMEEARLLAAAPDLYFACEQAWGNPRSKAALEKYAPGILDLLDKALNKAEKGA